MKKTIVRCDHCGTILDEMHDYVGIELDFVEWKTADLCKKCADELQDIIDKFVREYQE